MIAFFLYLYLVAAGLTLRFRMLSETASAQQFLSERRPAVLAYWFEHALLIFFKFRHSPASALTTPQEKSDAFTSLAARLGLEVVKGALESGGRHALLTLMDRIRAGRQVLVAGDSPQGPVRRMRTLSLLVSQETGVPVIPVAVHCSRCLRMRVSGTAVFIPLPFATVEFRLGDPIMVEKGMRIEEMDGLKARIAHQLGSFATT